MNLKFTPRALSELDEILSYIEARAPAGAQLVQSRLKSLFELLQRTPQIGRSTSNSRLRRLKATPYPYLIFYEVSDDDVLIIGVRHSARDPMSMPDADH